MHTTTWESADWYRPRSNRGVLFFGNFRQFVVFWKQALCFEKSEIGSGENRAKEGCGGFRVFLEAFKVNCLFLYWGHVETLPQIIFPKFSLLVSGGYIGGFCLCPTKTNIPKSVSPPLSGGVVYYYWIRSGIRSRSYYIYMTHRYVQVFEAEIGLHKK